MQQDNWCCQFVCRPARDYTWLILYLVIDLCNCSRGRRGCPGYMCVLVCSFITVIAPILLMAVGILQLHHQDEYNFLKDSYHALVGFTILGCLLDFVLIIVGINYCYRKYRHYKDADPRFRAYRWSKITNWNPPCNFKDMENVKSIFSQEKGNINNQLDYDYYMFPRYCARTPLVLASFYGFYDSVQYILHQGANVRQAPCAIGHLLEGLRKYDHDIVALVERETTRGETASSKEYQNTLSLLIKAGCVLYNNATCQRVRSPYLRILLLHGDYGNIRLFIEAGFNPFKSPELIDMIHSEESYLDTEGAATYKYLLYQMENPPPLQRLCRNVIRSSLGGINVQEKIDSMSTLQSGFLPQPIVSYLKLETK